MDDHRCIKQLDQLQPRTDEELRAIWKRCPTGEAKELLWEIKRLQHQIVGIHITCISYAAGSGAAGSSIESYAQLLMKESAVQAYWRANSPELEREDPRKWAFALIGRQRGRSGTSYIVPGGHNENSK